jgi:hypothetical protein
MASQQTLFADAPAVTAPDRTLAYVEREQARKRGVAQVLYDLLTDPRHVGRWWTLPELERSLSSRGRKVLTTSISARLRDLRKPPYRAHVQSRTRAGSAHLVEYRVGVVAGEEVSSS